MSGRVETISVLKAAGHTDPGLQREVNEDRFHLDVSRRLFMVVDGVGGQAAGGKAADTAVHMLRSHLERQTGLVGERLREAITAANNEIHRAAGRRPEWNGMACVLTAVVVEDDRAVVGHVGDTRLYKVRHGRIEKVTRDHSPVGEREDAHELSELEAMRHPRRNEVYRDVGSDPHRSDDPEFIDVQDIPFEPDAALLLCSDGLTDLIDATSINEIVRRWAGQPHDVVKALIDAANDAGGKDNVTVVYVEGEQFASSRSSLPAASGEITRRLSTAPPGHSESAARHGGPGRAISLDASAAPRGVHPERGGRGEQFVRLVVLCLLTLVIVLALARSGPQVSLAAPEGSTTLVEGGRMTVHSTGSIAAALRAAPAGTTIVVEPGEYRETLTLKDHVRLVSRVRHEAIIRLPGAASEGEAAIVARGVNGAVVEGFRIRGDAATPLGTGVSVMNAEVSISNLEVTGAARAAIDIGVGSSVSLLGSDIRDNPGTALAVAAGANATISHNVFMRNGSAPGGKAMIVEQDSGALFTGNVFVGMGADVLPGSTGDRGTIAQDNWFVDARTHRVLRPRPGTR